MLPRLHVVTDDVVLAATNFPAQALEIVHQLGERVALHLRSRTVSSRKLYELASALGQLPGATILVNDRVDVACAVRSAGVQLPQSGLPPAAARLLLGEQRWIGCSVHDEAEARTALDQGADFLIAGTIYASESHPGWPPAGTDFVRRLCGWSACPVIAIGGIDVSRVYDCCAAGAHGVAVLRAVWRAERPVLAARQLLDCLQSSLVKS